MSQTKPQNIPSSTKPLTDNKTPMPKENLQKAAPHDGTNATPQQNKNPQTPKNQTSQK